jgi:hypothetical protein
LPQVELEEAMRTLHSPSNVVADAALANEIAASNATVVAMKVLRILPMTNPLSAFGCRECGFNRLSMM